MQNPRDSLAARPGRMYELPEGRSTLPSITSLPTNVESTSSLTKRVISKTTATLTASEDKKIPELGKNPMKSLHISCA